MCISEKLHHAMNSISGGSRGVSLVSVETPFQILSNCNKSPCASPTSMLYYQTVVYRSIASYINNYIPTIILHVYFSNDVASLQKSDVTESESDDCQ